MVNLSAVYKEGFFFFFCSSSLRFDSAAIHPWPYTVFLNRQRISPHIYRREILVTQKDVYQKRKTLQDGIYSSKGQQNGKRTWCRERAHG